MISIGFSIAVIIVAALNLFIDFEEIKQTVDSNAPKYAERYLAFSLILTIVWLYLEFISLLNKLKDDDD